MLPGLPMWPPWEGACSKQDQDQPPPLQIHTARSVGPDMKPQAFDEWQWHRKKIPRIEPSVKPMDPAGPPQEREPNASARAHCDEREDST